MEAVSEQFRKAISKSMQPSSLPHAQMLSEMPTG
jgi:hypothetical protein